MSSNPEKERDDISYWRRKAEALQEWCQQLENDKVALHGMIQNLIAEKKQWEKEKVNQGNIIQQVLDERNKVNNEILQENERLRAEIRKLKNGTVN